MHGAKPIILLLLGQNASYFTKKMGKDNLMYNLNLNLVLERYQLKSFPTINNICKSYCAPEMASFSEMTKKKIINSKKSI